MRLYAKGLLTVTLLAAGMIIVGWLQAGNRVLAVQTGSMEPVFWPGDGLVVKPVDFRRLRVGDIVSYHSSIDQRTIVSHRIISLQLAAGRVVTQGDHLRTPDPAVNRDQLVGLDTAVLPHFGRLIDLLRSPGGLIGIVYVPALIIIARELRRLIQTNHYTHPRLRQS